MMAMSISPPRVGHIVALEGPSDLVATQLRLLPNSQQILVLPSLEHYLRNPSPDAPFDARELIHRYHTASQVRHSEALEFLRPSTSTEKRRLVLMHGGTMSAQVACLSTIMEHESEGDIEEAHATYIRLASNGVPGLSSTRFSHPQTGVSIPNSVERNPSPKLAMPNEKQDQKDLWEAYFDAGADTMENRIIRAMRAADELDKETEFLQPVTPDVDLTVKLVDIPSRSKKRLSSTAVEEPESLRCSKPPTPRDGEARLLPRVSPGTLSAEEPASTASRKPALKIRIPSRSAPWAGDVAADSDRHTPAKVYYPRHTAPQISHHRRSHTAESNLSPTQKSAEDEATQENLPSLDSEAGSLSQGEGAATSTKPETSQVTEANDAPVEPVLPLLEDLVVFFTPETPNELHNFVFRRLSEGFKTPRQSISGSVTQRHDSFFSAETSCLSMEEGDEPDQPQSEDGHVNNGAAPWAHKDLIHGLPTPNHSPNPMDASSVVMPRLDTRLYSISVGEETAASIQNFLRSFLGSQFPLPDRKYSTPDGVELTEAGLWRPLECDGQVVPSNGEPRLDLILAVGAESGVKKNRLSEIVEQIDQLGFKTSGLSRSGRLDIRYLIANAMQAFTAQPLTKQTQSNPFADRALLAALIIPHLETYLATHPDVRFLLIEYPSEHLPTVIALQTLIGTEMMKVVGVINSDASLPAQSLAVPETERRPSEGFRSLNRRGSRPSGTFVGPCSFSKANFLLASSATGFETAAFVAAIRESLISISDFYIPDRPLYRHPNPHHTPRKGYPTLTVNNNTATAPDSNQKSSSCISTSTLLITPPSSPTDHSPPHHHVNPRSVPPRTSSSTCTCTSASASSTPNRAPRDNNKSYTPPTAEGGRIRWGEVNYFSPPAPAPAAAAAAVSVPSVTVTSTTATATSTEPATTATATAAAAEAGAVKWNGHRHTDSEPLSPCAPAPAPAPSSIPPSSSLSSSSVPCTEEARKKTVVAAGGAAVSSETGDDENDEEEDDDDDVPDAEERRLMPLYLRRREDVERGRSSKALRWLGLV